MLITTSRFPGWYPSGKSNWLSPAFSSAIECDRGEKEKRPAKVPVEELGQLSMQKSVGMSCFILTTRSTHTHSSLLHVRNSVASKDSRTSLFPFLEAMQAQSGTQFTYATVCAPSNRACHAAIKDRKFHWQQQDQYHSIPLTPRYLLSN